MNLFLESKLFRYSPRQSAQLVVPHTCEMRTSNSTIPRNIGLGIKSAMRSSEGRINFKSGVLTFTCFFQSAVSYNSKSEGMGWYHCHNSDIMAQRVPKGRRKHTSCCSKKDWQHNALCGCQIHCSLKAALFNPACASCLSLSCL